MMDSEVTGENITISFHPTLYAFVHNNTHNKLSQVGKLFSSHTTITHSIYPK